MYNPTLILMVLCPLVTVTGGCSRRSIAPPVTGAPPVTNSPTHQQQCNLEEVQQAACIQDQGTCFAVELQGERKAFCSCFDDWIGTRCQEQEIPFDWMESKSADQIRRANLAAGISISILVVLIVLIAISIYIKWRKKERLLRDREFEASAEELYRRPFSGRTSIVESISRASSVRRGVPEGDNRENINGSQSQPLRSEVDRHNGSTNTDTCTVNNLPS